MENSKSEPKRGVETPPAKWQFLNVMQDVLPERDQKIIRNSVAKGDQVVVADFEKPIRDQI